MRHFILPLFLFVAFSCIAQDQIPKLPVDSEATGPTQQLYRYLRDKVWGKQVVSGCQARWDYNTMDADGLYERTGKYPAINIFDFLYFE